MTVHLEAKEGDYADIVLLPGDPLRAKWIADTYFEDVIQVNGVRNCFLEDKVTDDGDIFIPGMKMMAVDSLESLMKQL